MAIGISWSYVTKNNKTTRLEKIKYTKNWEKAFPWYGNEVLVRMYSLDYKKDTRLCTTCIEGSKIKLASLNIRLKARVES
jgi:hypothetical protein